MRDLLFARFGRASTASPRLGRWLWSMNQPEGRGIKGTISHVNNPSSPFAKGGPRGILLSVRLPEDHHSILTLRAKLNYTTSRTGGF